jgi:hypothetical protein
MRFRITFCSLFAIIFVIIFKAEFKREIGLKSPTLLGLLILGTMVIRELFINYKLTKPL